MSRTMIQAAVSMNQLQNKLDLIGNNLANSQTTGYKGRQADFSSLLFQQMNNMTDPKNAEGRSTPDGLRIGSGVRLGSTNTNMALGSLMETDRGLDTALTRENDFFQIQVTENGVAETRYTRNGAFYLAPIDSNQAVMLTTADGNPVIGENGPIVIPAGFDGISIRGNGEIIVKRGNAEQIAGQLSIMEVIRPKSLEATGQNAFRLPDLEALGYNLTDIVQATGPNDTVVKSGALERSNVDISKEMTDMILTQRSYQFNARTISMSDQMMGLVNQLR